MSASALGNSRQVIFLVTGTNKKDAVKLWRSGSDLPVSAIHANKITIMLDGSRSRLMFALINAGLTEDV